MTWTSRAIACCLPLALLGAAPAHVQTADYWGGYAGTHRVPASEAARALTWAETNPADSQTLRALGVKTILYSNPNRIEPSDTMYRDRDELFAHTCDGSRVTTHAELRMTDPRANALLDDWKSYVQSHDEQGHYTAVFEDEAVGTAYSAQQPCGYSLQNWIAGEIQLQRRLGYPVIYNALSDMSGGSISPEIALNASAIGGMMEQCYAQSAPDTRASGSRWEAAENTELQMARAGKYFFCYGNDLTPAVQAIESRLYTYASFLLTYDPRTSVLWEYYGTPSGGHVMPESQLVPFDPVMRSVPSIDALRQSGGVYVREYRNCSIRGRPIGACIVAVNPDSVTHTVDFSHWHRQLQISGSGIFDGGNVAVVSQRPASDIPPLQAVIAFR
ncbi:MAG TPA: hypothetical protein VGZ02_03670 [Candidatus Baltobacteraceae bacterium]|nr:hypothetical protein [Candidatus Baltobacteraceae bacterium]